MGQNFHKIEAVRLEGGDPSPQAVSLTAFFPLYYIYLYYIFLLLPLFLERFDFAPKEPAMAHTARRDETLQCIVARDPPADRLRKENGREAVAAAPDVSFFRITGR